MDENLNLTEGTDITPADTDEVTDGAGSEAFTKDSDTDSDTVTESMADSSFTDEDYSRLAEEDILAIRESFAEAREYKSIAELDDPKRFCELRDMGLSVREAYLATRRPPHYDNRAHLIGAAPKSAGGPVSSMTSRELESARDLFGGLSDSEIQSLYRRVSKQ